MTGTPDPFDEMERFFDQLTQFGTAVGGDVPVDVVDEDDAFVVVADLPGYDTDDIEVQLEGKRRLTVSATREAEHDDRDDDSDGDSDGDYVRREREHHHTSRSVTLPEAVDGDDTEASYENGVLTVRLGKQTVDGNGTDIPVN